MKLTTRTLVSLLLTIGLATTFAGNALANVAANTQIINQATLSYDDGTGTKTSTTQVTVTVSVLPSTPSIIAGPPQETAYNGPGTTLTNSFIVTASANGPDNYTLATSITGSTNSSNPTAPTAAITSGTTITLGATVTFDNSSTTTNIVVPADGTTNSPTPSVNGIVAGDFVSINGNTREVQSVTDNASGTSTIILQTALTLAPTAGTIVAEQKTVSVNVTAGDIVTVGTDVTVDKTLTATSVLDVLKTITSNPVTDTYTSGAATLAKYVRNVDTPSGTGTAFTYDSTAYYQSGVNGAPGETLEYLLVATNTGGGAVTASFVTDVLPTDFVTLVSNAYGASQEVTYESDLAVVTTLSAAADVDAATYDGGTSTLTVYVGTGATSSAGGSIPGGTTSVYTLYQVSINP